VSNEAIPFRFNLPFHTKCGWPARLLGVVQRAAFPYVVAVWNPTFGGEEIHSYGEDGNRHENVDGLTLVNTSDEEYYGTTRDTRVHAYVKEMPSWPPNCNAMRHDLWNMGTPLLRGWIALHEGYGRPDFPDPLRWVELVNEVSGQRFRVHFHPVHGAELRYKERNKETT
jgi:hypothetical protein